MNIYIIKSKNKEVDNFLSFTKFNDALAYHKCFPDEYEYPIQTSYIQKINVNQYINWNDIPKQFNFIYRDSDGVFACLYKPKFKWFKDDYSVLKMYGGEKVKLDYKNYHELIELGSYYESYRNTFHYIDWKKVKDSHALKFIDHSSNPQVEVFNQHGELIVSGDNVELKIVNKNATHKFDTFFQETHKFIR